MQKLSSAFLFILFSLMGSFAQAQGRPGPDRSGQDTVDLDWSTSASSLQLKLMNVLQQTTVPSAEEWGMTITALPIRIRRHEGLRLRDFQGASVTCLTNAQHFERPISCRLEGLAALAEATTVSNSVSRSLTEAMRVQLTRQAMTRRAGRVPNDVVQYRRQGARHIYSVGDERWVLTCTLTRVTRELFGQRYQERVTSCEMMSRASFNR